MIRRFLFTAATLLMVPGIALAASTEKAAKFVTPLPSVHHDDNRDISSFMNYGPKEKAINEETIDIHFSADEVENDQELGIITAKGDVNIIRETLTLKADKVIYNQKEDIITAVGNVVLLEETGNVVFSDYVVLSDQMSQGEMQNIKVILKDKSRLAARSVTRLENNDKLMKNAIYTACDVCEGQSPLWQLKAHEVIHDAEGKNVNYKNAFLELKGTPIFYTPFLSHPDPTVKRRSGFLAPSIRSNSYLGAGFQPRYFWDISDQEDMVLSPIFSTDKGVVLDASYRKYFYSGELNFEGSFLNDSDNDRNRGHLYLNGRYEINNNWVATLDYNYATDGAYLKDLTLENREDAWLTSNAKIEGFDNRNYASVQAYYYKLISSNLPKLNKPYVVPMFQYENISDTTSFGGYAKTQLDFASILREGDDTSSQRASVINSWVLPYTSRFGEKYKLQLSNKTDFYYIDGYQNAYGDNYDGTAMRMFPQLGLEWKLPFVKATNDTRQILEPTIVAVAAPNGGNKPNKIMNDDSLYQELDDTNILSLDRMPGYDRNDTGSRISYGLNWSSYGNSWGQTQAFIAQSYRFKKDDPNAFGNDVDKESNFSDYVGRIYATPHEYLDLNYRFRLDRSDFDLKYSELSVVAGPKILSAYIAYIYLQEDKNSAIQGYD
ncbi:MAG: LPS assembly protein LptD, partial [Lactobacillus sp.]|nr:LPS assembly protein LptD [Lactobacillus sp.]